MSSVASLCEEGPSNVLQGRAARDSTGLPGLGGVKLACSTKNTSHLTELDREKQSSLVAPNLGRNRTGPH